MARATIRAFPMYFNGQKIAELSSGTYDIAGNDEAQIATEGYMGHSDGATMTKFNPTCIIPISGMQSKLEDALINKQYVQIGIPANGKFHQVDARIVAAAYKWDFKNGAATGDFTIEGGNPTRV